MVLEEKSDIERLGKKLAEKRCDTYSPHKKVSFSSVTKMNHDKKAESGRKILREKLFSRL